MKTKIVHIIIGLNVGGAELVLRRLVLSSQSRKNFQHEVISLTDKGIIGAELEAANIPVHTIHMHGLSSTLTSYLKLRNLLKRINPDIVQTWMYHADFLGGIAAKSIGVDKIIWGIRNSNVSTGMSKTTYYLSHICAKISGYIPSDIVAVSHTARDYHTAIGYDSNKMIVIPNGFDLEKFSIDTQKRFQMRLELDIKEDQLVIGNIGRFNPVKNQLNFIKACITLFDEGYTFIALLAGRNVDLRNPKIYNLLNGSKYTKNFIFLGEIEDTTKFYNAIDIFCLCSTTEGFPNVLGEAMSTERVCLSTKAGDAELILGNKSLLIHSTDCGGIASTLEQVVFKNPNNFDFNVLGMKARERIESNYSISKIVSDFESLYLEDI
uniref:Glycosyl transferase, group 1 n=1 Tax=Psychrobacter sp. (strain PRwf-1) TaxID=349106 RepID=A5WBZ9_PSYWF